MKEKGEKTKTKRWKDKRRRKGKKTFQAINLTIGRNILRHSRKN